MGGLEDVIFVENGRFSMGLDFGVYGKYLDETPRHQVYLSGYFMERTEISIRLWNHIRDWAEQNGYNFSEEQKNPLMSYTQNSAGYPDFPMNMISWVDCIKWCNARSEFMGRKPVYYTDSSLEQVFRSSESPLSDESPPSDELHFQINQIDFKASGYRLPTEAEWERAAKGTPSYSLDYPWGSGINGSRANYKLSGDPKDDGTTPIGYYNSNQKIDEAKMSYSGENKIHADESNALGFYDIIGNVSEWCWDWYDETGYNRPSTRTTNDPHGQDFSYEESNMNQTDESKWKMKVHRGGSYKSDPSTDNDFLKDDLRITSRGVEFTIANKKTIGLRTVRRNLDDALWFDKKKISYNRWFQLDWYGYYYDSGKNWVYHTRFGWIYPIGNGSYSNWIYFHHKKGWLWTSKYAYPWHYDPSDSKWYEELSDAEETGWFQSKDGLQKYKWGNGI